MLSVKTFFCGHGELPRALQSLGAIHIGKITQIMDDQVGWCMPHEFGDLIAGIKANTPGADNVVISTHCQNDLGLATANSLSGAYKGARQCECTINGIGERAGNASLEEVAMSIEKRGYDSLDHWLEGCQRIALGGFLLIRYLDVGRSCAVRP